MLENSVRTASAGLFGKAKNLLINDGWVPAVSGRTFESINPSNGSVLASIAAEGAANVSRAVAAARAASMVIQAFREARRRLVGTLPC